jgi:hypothetical protein
VPQTAGAALAAAGHAAGGCAAGLRGAAGRRHWPWGCWPWCCWCCCAPTSSDSWRRATPPDAPNRFVINLQPEQGDAFRAALARAGVQRYDWYPMIRGRLVSVNGRAVGPSTYTERPRAARLVEREFNLSHAAAAAARTTSVVAGRWTPEERRRPERRGGPGARRSA